jgi:hypothetical protein
MVCLTKSQYANLSQTTQGTVEPSFILLMKSEFSCLFLRVKVQLPYKCCLAIWSSGIILEVGLLSNASNRTDRQLVFTSTNHCSISLQVGMHPPSHPYDDVFGCVPVPVWSEFMCELKKLLVLCM